MIHHSWDANSGILVVRAVDHVTIEDRIDFVNQIIRDLSLPDRAPVLIDVTRISNAPTLIDSEKMAHLLYSLAERFQSRIAYVAVGVGHLTPYRLAALLVDASIVEAKTFTDSAEAVDWLTVSP